ncbi:MAG: sugar ABC transporter permease [Chloroflexi bacterium]|nr:sugar ABC transporter permease [Chloroflexota bacterium]
MVASLVLSLTNYSIKADRDTEFIGFDHYEKMFSVQFKSEEDKSSLYARQVTLAYGDQNLPVYNVQVPVGELSKDLTLTEILRAATTGELKIETQQPMRLALLAEEDGTATYLRLPDDGSAPGDPDALEQIALSSASVVAEPLLEPETEYAVYLLPTMIGADTSETADTADEAEGTELSGETGAIDTADTADVADAPDATNTTDEADTTTEGNKREHLLLVESADGATTWLDLNDTAAGEFTLPTFPDEAERAQFVPFDDGYSNVFDIGALHFGARDYRFWKSLQVTLKYAVFALPATLALALFFAVLTNTQVMGVTLFRTLFYLPTVIPQVVAATVFQQFLRDADGWLNVYFLDFVGINGPDWLNDPAWATAALTLISTWGIGTAMLMFLAGLQNIPTELYEASRVDGANFMRRFRHITIPMLSPVILYNLVIGLVGTFQYFTIAYTLTVNATGNPYGREYSMFFYNTNIYHTAYAQGEMGQASALAWVLLAVILVVTLLVFRSSTRWVYYAAGEA